MADGDVVVIGATTFTQDGETHEYQRGRGWSIVRTYSGPLSALNAKEQELRAEGAYSISSTQGPVCRITARFSQESDVGGDGSDVDATIAEEQADWDLTPYDLQKELGTHGQFNQSASSPPVIARMNRAIKDGTIDDTDWETEYPGRGELDGYADLRAMGVTSWLTYGFRLRKTVITAEDSVYGDIIQINNEIFSGKVVTWGDIGIPLTAKIAQPRVRHFVGAGVDNPPAGSTVPDGASNEWAYVYITEWLQKPLGVGYQRAGKRRKRRYVQEWIGAVQWNALLYDGGTGLPST